MIRVFSFRLSLFASLLFATSLLRAIASPPIAPTEALPPEEEKKKFKLPPGFEAQLVVAEPDIQKPMNLAFDARGRLWVTHSVEYPFAAADPSKARDGLSVLEFDPSGKVSKITRFADNLNIPIGVLPLAHRNEAIVWSIPHIWRLTDTDGDGVADKREILYGPFDYADTHGNQNAFRRGLDGWIYANHGFRNQSKVKIKGEGPVVLQMTSGNTYRYRAEGTAIEQQTWGQVNPFGSCFDHRNDWYNSDCHSKPIMMLIRGGYYESFGTRNDGLGLAPPVTKDGHGSTGLAGIVYCDNPAFPKEYQGGFFIGNVVNNSIHFDMPTHRGSSPWVEKPANFMTSDDWWYRPVDIQLGPDGALYIADFYNCIIGHYEVDLRHPRRDRQRGRIWRIVWKGLDGKAPYRAPEDLTKLSADQLVDRIGDGNISLRIQCLHELVDRFGAQGAKVLEARAATANQQVMAIWMRYRLGTLAGSDLKSLLKDDPVVRVHLVKALAELDQWTPQQNAFVRNRASDPDPFVRRAAAEAMGRHPDADHLPALFKIWEEAHSDDVQLVHTARIALRNHYLLPEIFTRLSKTSLPADRTAKAIDIAIATPSESAAQFALKVSIASDVPQAVLARCVQHAARFLKPENVDELAELVQKRYPADRQVQISLLQSIHSGMVQRGGMLQTNSTAGKWAATLARAVLSDEKLLIKTTGDADGSATLTLAFNVAGNQKLVELLPRVQQVVRDKRQPVAARSAAAQTALILSSTSDAVLAEVLTDLGEPLEFRKQLAQLLAPVDSASARTALAKSLETAAPALQQVFAEALASTTDGAGALLKTIAAGKASPYLLQDKLVLERIKAAKLPDSEVKIASLTKNLAPADERIRKLLATRAKGFEKANLLPERGLAVFKQHCAICHKANGEGALIGPQLEGIGVRGLDRLLEDVLDPSRNVEAAFRPLIITTRSGKVLAGVKLREEGKAMIVADNQGKEIRIPLEEIEEQNQSPLSLMPANLADAVPEDDFYQLMGFLLRLRTK